MTTLSTHVLDAALGRPAAGLALSLRRHDDGVVVEEAVTDDDGRVRFVCVVSPAVHIIVFATGPWFAAAGRETFFPEVGVAFEIDPAQSHHHVALLLSPYSYTTYRGS